MELELIKFFQSLTCDFLDVIFFGASFLGSWIGFVICFTFMLLFSNKIYSLFFAGTYGIGVAINWILKSVINKLRPYQIDLSIVDRLHANGSSMPSGHTVSAIIICIFLIFIICKTAKHKNTKVISVFFIILFFIMVVISRMYLGQHFLTDILAGMAVGTVVSVFGLIAYKYRKNGDKTNLK
ncbi:MAG: phosphatase PAP2 family protein [Clostridia bacterium]